LSTEIASFTDVDGMTGSTRNTAERNKSTYDLFFLPPQSLSSDSELSYSLRVFFLRGASLSSLSSLTAKQTRTVKVSNLLSISLTRNRAASQVSSPKNDLIDK